MARAMPEGARVVSIEFNAANAAIARRIWDHAGIADQLSVVVGTLGDGDKTMDVLEAEHGFDEGSVEFTFIDHDKDAYLPDLRRILQRGWLRAGSIVVADTSSSREGRPTGLSWPSRRGSPGAPSSTRPTSSTSRCSRISCSSRSIWAYVTELNP
jgi:catechol O-methyltransferase